MAEFVHIAVFLVLAGAFVYVIVGAVSGLASKERKTVRISARVSEKSDGEPLSVKFETDGGEVLSFPVTKSEFEDLNAGDAGTLAYRGEAFLGFMPDSLASKGDKS